MHSLQKFSSVDAVGFDYAALTLLAVIGQRPNLDECLTILAARMRRFGITASQDRLTAAIIIESEANNHPLADAELLLNAAAATRQGP